MSRALALAATAVVVLAARGANAQTPIPAQPLPAAPPPVAAPPVAAPAPVAAPHVYIGAPVAAPPVYVPAPAPATAPPVAPAPGAVVNPADGPGECVTTTTTTTRCTGAAAPYASHPAPPTVIVAPPAPVYAAPAVVPCVIPSGWKLEQDPDGSLWRVRHHRGTAALWGPGLGVWMLSYFAAEVGGFVGDFQPEATFPVIGAFVAAGLSHDTAQAMWAVDGVAQLGGFIMFVAGASMGDKLERLPVTVAPTSFYGGGGGVALTGRF